MGPADRFTSQAASQNVNNWAEDHAEGAFLAARAVSRALDLADCADVLEAPDEDWFEDDLLSLIQNRPSRHLRPS